MKTERIGTLEPSAVPGAPRRRRLFLAALFLLNLFAAIGLLGCFGAGQDERVAGGDDIPNDVEPLGKKAARARDDSADWNGFKSLPRTAPGLYDTTAVPDTVPDTSGAGRAQPKRSARPAGPDAAGLPPLENLLPLDTLVTRAVDSAPGLIEAVHVQVKDSVVKADSTLLASGGVVRVSGRITYADTSLWKAYSFRDGDGDGLLAPRAGSANLADMDLRTRSADGAVEHIALRLAAGGDLDFNARGDNRLISCMVVRTLGADTLDVYRFQDADGDSVLLDFARESNLIALGEEHHYASGAPLVSAAIEARLVAFSGDPARNHAVHFRRRSVFRDGGVLTVAVKGPAADSSFRAGEEAAWSESLLPAAGDSVAAQTRVYTVKLAPVPGGFQGNLLMAFAVERLYRNAPYDRFAFSLRPETPVPDGRWPATGAVNAVLSDRAGATIEFTGQAVAGGMEGMATTSAGTTLTLFFDRNGAATRRP